MTADKIIDLLIDMRHETIDEENLVEEVLLGPSQTVLNLIKEAGGKIGKSEWEEWENSHSPGQSHRTVFIPQSWILQDVNLSELSQVFIIDNDDNFTPRLIVPSEIPELVYEIREEHYAVRTSAAELQDVAASDTDMSHQEYYDALAEQFGVDDPETE